MDVADAGAGPAEVGILEVVSRVCPPDVAAEARAWRRLDSLTKPPRSLGRMEELAARVSAIQDDVRPASGPARIICCAADHGVVAEAVSAYPQAVTVQMVANLAEGGAAVNQFAAHLGVEVLVCDVGVASDTTSIEGVQQAKVRSGTANMAYGPAMSREEACQAVSVGIALARRAAGDGVRFIGTGEMGIGNTTAASALIAALAGVPVSSVVGRGTGLDDTGLARKAAVVERALMVNRVDPTDPVGVLAAVGGLEIAALAGVVIGGAASGVCVIADGLISTAAALVALRMCPEATAYLFPSHLSAEPGHGVALQALDLDPVLDLDMRLGEGTGAVLAIGLLGAACRMMSGMATFDEAGVSGAVE